MTNFLTLLKNAFTNNSNIDERTELMKTGNAKDVAASVLVDTAGKIFSDITSTPHNSPTVKHTIGEEVIIVTNRVITDFTGGTHTNIVEGMADSAKKIAENPVSNSIILAGEIVTEVVEEAISTKCCGLF